MTKKSAPRNFYGRHKKLTVFLTVVTTLIIIGLGRFWYEWSIYKDMRDLADQFKPDSTLIKQHDYFVWPSLLCIGDEPCPMYDRSWNVTKPVTPESVNGMLQASKIESPLSRECIPPSNGGGNITMCETQYTRDGYTVNISFSIATYDRSKDYVLVRVLRNV